MNPPKMPIHIGDLLRDTGHLRALLIGAYLLLLFHHWSTGALPDDDDQLSAIARMSPAEWRKSRPILERFFQQPGWRHGRVEEDLASAKQSYEKRAKAGAEGGKAKATAKQSSSNATAGPEQPLTFNQDTKEERTSLRSERARATRLPNEWVPSENDLAFAVGKGLAMARIETEALKFLNYWTSKSGQGATKTDWSKTWQNWILTATQGVATNGKRTVHDAARDLSASVAARIRELDQPAPELCDEQGRSPLRLLPSR
jgi:uncharacterized protein YdaU (DUF1376 family)